MSIPRKTVFTADFRNLKKQWTNGPEALKIQMTDLLREINTMFISLVQAHRVIESAKQIAVTSSIADVPQVDVEGPAVDKQIDGVPTSVPETLVVSDTTTTNQFDTASSAGESTALHEELENLKRELATAQRVSRENTALREELEKAKREFAVVNRLCQEKENLIVTLKEIPTKSNY